MFEVPELFRPVMPFSYPSHNSHEFERWYFDNHKDHEYEGRIYLPIFWTAYYVKYGINKGAILDKMAYTVLQNWLKSALDIGYQYYTIVQHDDGILHDLSGLDIKVFHMSGHKDHYKSSYPLPLLATPHNWNYNNKRTYLASFIGQMTHPVRAEMGQLFKHDPEVVYATAKTGQKVYCELMSRSIFALCPRGYGPTSFRIQEAIQYGAIPIYISDKFVEPYNLSFNGYGEKVPLDQVKNLKYVLKTLLDVGVTNDGVLAMRHLFTYQGCKDMILKNLSLD